MNAVILLVWLAAADQAVPAPKAAPAHVHPAPASVVVHGSCNDCCNSCGHSMFGKLRGLFHRSCDDGCKESCRSGHPLFHQRHQDSCCDEGGHKLFGFMNRWRHHDCGDPCCKDSGCREHLGHKLRNRFHGIFRKHDDDCCGTTAPAVIHAYPSAGKPAGEKIAPPKEIKPLPKMDKADKKVELTPQPPAGLTLEAPGLTPQR